MAVVVVCIGMESFLMERVRGGLYRTPEHGVGPIRLLSAMVHLWRRDDNNAQV